jgi:hypothetical protein
MRLYHASYEGGCYASNLTLRLYQRNRFVECQRRARGPVHFVSTIIHNCEQKPLGQGFGAGIKSID